MGHADCLISLCGGWPFGHREPNEDQDHREEQAGDTDARRGCWEFPCSIKAVDLYSVCQDVVVVVTAPLSWPRCCWGWISISFTGSQYIKKPPK